MDGDDLTYLVIAGPANGELSGDPPSLTYTPDANFHGSDSFTFTVSDGIADPVQATISINVTEVPDPSLPAIQIERIAGGCRITLTAESPGRYRVDWSENLKDWYLVEEKTASESGEMEFTDMTATDDNRFYRASARK